MNELYFVYDIFYFVCLKMTDHMPFDILGERLVFFAYFLYFIFTENTYSKIICFFQH